MAGVRIVKVWASTAYQRLHSSLWFLPAVCVAIACGLAVLILNIDFHFESYLSENLWLYAGTAEGARQTLSTLASALITVAGVVFSILIVALSLASQQFGPRLLRTFMNNTSNQVVLGIFIATFIFNLLILIQINEEKWDVGAPRLAITVGVVLAILAFSMLIYFIHHMAASVQVSTIVQQVANELGREIDSIYPEQAGVGQENDQERSTQLPEKFEADSRKLIAQKAGYIESINVAELLDLAVEHDLVIRLNNRPGHYMVQEAVFGQVWPTHRVDDKLHHRLSKTITISKQRTPTQDIEFSIDQLVQISLRALSPSMNDPLTAINCVDVLSNAICRMLERSMPGDCCYDDSGKLRLQLKVFSVEGVINAALNQIRQAASDNIAVSLRLLELFARVGPCVKDDSHRQLLLRQAEMIRRAILSHATERFDAENIESRYHAAIKALGQIP